MSGKDWGSDGRSIGVFFGDLPMLAVLFNAAGHDVEFTLPDRESVLWHLLLDTAFDERGNAPPDGAMTTFTVRAHSTAVFSGLPA
jgi:pullulanase/glycogen debranching enzyme